MTMLIHTGTRYSRPRNLLSILLLAAHVSSAWSRPQPVYPRQNVFDNLKFPPCALTCFVNEVLTDGCANESDFDCHCGAGNIMGKVATCAELACNEADKADAKKKVLVACGALGMDESNTSVGASSTIPSTTTIPSNPSPTRSAAPDSSQRPIPRSSNAISQTPTTPNPTLSASSSSPPMSSTRFLPSPSSTPTAIPPALNQSSRISDGAKAGIAVSLSVLALSIFFALSWYIRHLKRALKTAQSQTTTSAPTWQPDMTAIPPPRRWSSRRRSPVSPLSPVSVSDNGYGVLKKKRGHVLSVVVEDDEDRNSLVQEPVPGQREGLSAPLELDAEGTAQMGVFEAPLAITPRERSRESLSY